VADRWCLSVHMPHAIARMRMPAVAAALILLAAADRTDGQTQERPLPIDGMAAQPERTKTVVPSYPSDAKSGTVLLRVKIDPDLGCDDGERAKSVERMNIESHFEDFLDTEL
jgi:hypothetical protein